MFIFSYANALELFVCFTLLRKPPSFTSFDCMHLRFAYIYVRWTYGSICIIHEASFIIRLRDSYLHKIMWYKTYESFLYAKILISIRRGSVHQLFVYVWFMSQYGIGKGDMISNPLSYNLYYIKLGTCIFEISETLGWSPSPP